MKKYNKEFRERLQKAVYEKAEVLASEVDQDGLNAYNMQVEVDCELFDFTVDVMISNYEIEEETNSQSYNVEVFCTFTPKHPNKFIQNAMAEDFYLETLYKD